MRSAETAAYIAAGVALVVGLINPVFTAVMAGRRQREQLRHDRLTRLREELVNVVEQAGIALNRARRKHDNIEYLWRDDFDVDSDLAHAEVTAQSSAVEEGRAAYTRLLLRFDRDDPVAATFSEAATALDDYLFVLHGYNEREPYSKHEKAIHDLQDTAFAKELGFLRVARDELESTEP